MRPIVEITADGSCLKNPGGAGGYGIIVESAGGEVELSGGEASTTNNRMELMAAIVALESLQEPSDVTMRLDAEYVIKGMTTWMPSWKKRKFVGVKNQDLWQRLLKAAHRHSIDWTHVKGHAGDPRNERVDKLAYKAAKANEAKP